MRIFTLIAAAAALAAISTGALALEPGQKAPTFKLQDQFGTTWDLSALRGNVVVLVVADRDSGRAMDPWVSNLKTRFNGKIKLLGMLDLHGVPGLFRGVAKSRIRRETKDPLALDFEGKITRSYGVSSKMPTVVVIDPEGIVQSAQTVAYSAEAFKTTTAAIDKALQARGQ